MKVEQSPNPPSGPSLSIDVKRLLSRSLRFWYVVVLTLILALVVAFINNRYATRIYPTTASLIVKEAEDISGGDLIYNNPLVNFRRNYLNELYIIKSYPLIQRVIEDLNFDVLFYRQGSILSTESYNDLPFAVFADRSKSVKVCSFKLTVLDENEFRLDPLDENENLKSQTFAFTDSISYGDFKGRMSINEPGRMKQLEGESLIFNYVPSSTLTQSYMAQLKAEWAEEGAGVVNLSINGPNPRKSKDFLAGLIARYQDLDLENKNVAASRAVDFITDQLVGISDSLAKVEMQLETFKSKNVVTNLSEEAVRLFQKIEVFEEERMKYNVARNYYKYLIDYLQKESVSDQVILPSSVGINDPILTGLISQMNELQLDIRMSAKSENPAVQNAVRSVQQIKKNIIESVRNQQSTDAIRLQFLDKQIKAVETQLKTLPLAQRNLVAIQRNYTLLENLHIFLLQRRSEAAISKASNTSDIQMVNPPRSGAAISPKSRVNYIIATAIGLSLPLLIFALIELLDNRVQSREDIEKLTQIPFIGGVGHKQEKNNLEVLTHPKTAIAESFRALRSNLNFFIEQKDKAVFMVTSSISGEGKTFTSINLASVIALSGKRTLIVGADMRKPKLFNDFALSNDLGLSTYLAGLSQFDQVVQKTSFSNLDLVSGGPVPPNPSELLLTSRMQQFIDEAKSRYDYVIIDTPPLAIVTDAFVLSTYANHTLFLVRQDYTPRELLRTAQDFFSSGRLKDISIVLNDIHRSGPGYGYNYQYSYGYGYLYGFNKTGDQGYYER